MYVSFCNVSIQLCTDFGTILYFNMCMLMILINWIYVNKSFICLLYGILET